MVGHIGIPRQIAYDFSHNLLLSEKQSISRKLRLSLPTTGTGAEKDKKFLQIVEATGKIREFNKAVTAIMAATLDEKEEEPHG